MSDSRLTASHEELQVMFETGESVHPRDLIIECVAEDLNMLTHHNELPPEFERFLMRAEQRLRFALGMPITREQYAEARVTRLQPVKADAEGDE